MGEETANENNTCQKRDRDDSGELDSHQHEFKRVYPVSCPDTNLVGSNRVDEEKSDSPVAYAGEMDEVRDFPSEYSIPEDILDFLDDSDDMPTTQDLDSVIRSFEEEIRHSSPSSAKPEVMELRSDSGEYQLDLGYLLEASDDELGLPPTVTTAVEQTLQEPANPPSRNDSEVADLGDMVAFEKELPSYDSLGFELGDRNGEVDNSNSRFVTADGLFEYSEPSDSADLAWLSGYT